MNKVLKVLALGIFLISFAVQAQAAVPVLNFSDLINGPKSGLGDGLGEGAIVTLWGNNLGTTQGASKIYFKDALGVSREMAHVYYWENADSGVGDSGPADMYTYHKMQELAVSIPSASEDGAGKIYVEVGGEVSNELDFYARSTGRFYFANLSGSEGSDGSWSSPRLLLGELMKNNSGVGAGDVLYATGDYVFSGSDGMRIGNSGSPISGALNNHIALSVYPGGTLSVTGTGSRPGIANYSSKNNFWVVSKVSTFSAYGGIEGNANGRIIGNNLQGRTGVTPAGSGALIDAGANFMISSGVNTIDNLKVFGNYLHDFGEPASNNNLLHTMYFRVRSDTRTLHAPEIAWNYLHDKDGPRFGIHYYDEGSDGDGEPAVGSFIDTYKIHHNVVREQTGAGINFTVVGGHDADFPVEIYNNLLINCGRKGVLDGDNLTGIRVAGAQLTGHFDIFNNTLYGWGETVGGAVDANDGVALRIPITGSNNTGFGGSYALRNNIFVDTHNLLFTDIGNIKTAVVSTNNLWYSPSGNLPPSGDTMPITTNPLFTGVNDFTLQSGSPARDAGVVVMLVTDDIFTTIRPQGSTYDIGAYEYIESGATARADVDQSGAINSTDALLTLRNSLGLTMSSTNWQSSSTTGDVNCDSNSNSTDALLILRSSLGLDMSGTGWCIS